MRAGSPPLPSGAISAATPPGTTTSIISRWPKACSAARSSSSRCRPAAACSGASPAASAMRPRSSRCPAIRSCSAITARKAAARGGAATSSAASAARAKATECATVASAASRATNRAAVRGDLPTHQRQRALVRVAQPGLCAQHLFAPRRQPQMRRFLDRAVDRADRDLHHPRLVQVGELRRLHGTARQAGPRRQRVGERPSPVVQPGAFVAPALRGVAPEVADHALEPRRGRPGRGKGGVAAGLDRDRRRQDIVAAAEQRMDLDWCPPIARAGRGGS